MKTQYLIDTPPATISGNLHIGHIFSYTQADIISRYQRYLGKDLIYPWCFDNNGLPTAKLASNRKIKGTENIINFSIDKSKEYLETFNEAGIHFSDNEYHTFSDSSIRIAHKAFHKLKEKGIIYKAETEYMWCPKQKCSISQSELNDAGIIERSGEMPEIKKGTGWFINIKDHIPQIKEKINQIDWKPSRFKQNALNWADNIQWDWSISRERHYGIPIPGEESLTLDTWFISSLSPQLAWNSFNGEESLDIPIFDMRYQGHDIIRTWAFYTIAMSYFLNDQIPWKTLMITGHTLDGDGNKESKSMGNATSPKPLIQQYKSSGIRWWSSSATLGTDLKLDEIKMKMGWRIQNKLSNAEKFIQMQIDNEWIGEDEALMAEYLRWKSDILKHFEDYELDKASDMIYTFFWNNFCDIWIEDSKNKPTSLTLQRIIGDFKPIIDIIL
jgi:valyl-tRNA synthetase